MDAIFTRFIDDHVLPQFRPVAEAAIGLIERVAPELQPGMRGGTEKYIPVPVWRLEGDVVVLSPSKMGITISFANGARFDDPAGLLGGTGRKSRTVLLKKKQDVDRPELVALIRQAVSLAG